MHVHTLSDLAKRIDAHFSYAVPAETVLVCEDWSRVPDTDVPEDEVTVAPYHPLDEAAHKHCEE